MQEYSSVPTIWIQMSKIVRSWINFQIDDDGAHPVLYLQVVAIPLAWFSEWTV